MMNDIMDRREALTSMAGMAGFIAIPAILQPDPVENPGNLPVIEFVGEKDASLTSEFEKNLPDWVPEWNEFQKKNIWDNREMLAWLSKENAVSYHGDGQGGPIWGEVLVWQRRHYFWDDKCICSTGIDITTSIVKTDNSFQGPPERNSFSHKKEHSK